MISKIKRVIIVGFILGAAGTSFAQDSVKCSPKPAQLKSLSKALIADVTNQLQGMGYQGVKVRLTTRKMSASESVSITKTGANFGLGVSVSKDADNKPTLSLNSQVTPSSVMCTYGYRFLFRVRYLNTDSRMVTVSYPAVDFNIQSQILYSNNIK